MRVTLTRRVTFAAAHRYRRPEWTEAQNRAAFGACANPHSHAHTYRCDVTVTGTVDPVTGMLIDLGAAAHVTTVTVAEDDTRWSTCHAD